MGNGFMRELCRKCVPWKKVWSLTFMWVFVCVHLSTCTQLFIRYSRLCTVCTVTFTKGYNIQYNVGVHAINEFHNYSTFFACLHSIIVFVCVFSKLFIYQSITAYLVASRSGELQYSLAGMTIHFFFLFFIRYWSTHSICDSNCDPSHCQYCTSS